VYRWFLRKLGFTPAEFDLIAWMTGWANCGDHARSSATDDNNINNKDKQDEVVAEKNTEEEEDVTVRTTGNGVGEGARGGIEDGGERTETSEGETEVCVGPAMNVHSLCTQFSLSSKECSLDVP
jgi:hypothetical protein